MALRRSTGAGRSEPADGCRCQVGSLKSGQRRDRGSQRSQHPTAARPPAPGPGAAARLVHHGDTIIVISYADYEEDELESYEPRVVHVNRENQIVLTDANVKELLA